jgi:hypothetical protein
VNAASAAPVLNSSRNRKTSIRFHAKNPCHHGDHPAGRVADALGHAIASYAERERRFGRTSAQLEPQSQNVDSLPC